MRRRGIVYDVGRVLGVNWRPDYAPGLVRRELTIIRDDLHCNAVRIVGRNPDRLISAAGDALDLGLEVWLSPELWDHDRQRTLRYLIRVATVAERLAARYPGRLVFSVGSELTLFMRGIAPGRSFAARLRNPGLAQFVRSGAHNAPLNAFLATACESVRAVFTGPLTYASLAWEDVDWTPFDFVGIDHYRDTRIADRYVTMLQPALATGKPVEITEVGHVAGRHDSSGPIGAGMTGNVDFPRLFIHHTIPLIGRLVRPRLRGTPSERNEAWQAEQLTQTLTILDDAGVDGVFVFTFVHPLNPYDDDPRYDLDRVSPSLVKSYEGRHGTVYPDMTWDPKPAFDAVATFYADAERAQPSPGPMQS